MDNSLRGLIIATAMIGDVDQKDAEYRYRHGLLTLGAVLALREVARLATNYKPVGETVEQLIGTLSQPAPEPAHG